jgi:sterol desaturase/sphingolipid hydroxylase (fatty acid hydroxylase superfamily)
MIPTLMLILMPLLFALMIIEAVLSFREEKHLYTKKDLVNNLIVGLIYLGSRIISKLFLFYSFRFVYCFRLFDVPNTWYIWIIAFIGADFSYYWFHRASHEVGWLWASHATHHSSEKYNLSTALRVSFTSNTFIFWIWLPLAGFSPVMVSICIQICMLYQAFLHSETVKKLPSFIEYYFNTPSHHRVHHSSNLEYLDKNHGGVLMIWDRLFGTFQNEDEQPVYGLTTALPVNKPVAIILYEWKRMFRKAMSSGSFKNAINYFIQPPGWSHDGSTKTVKQLRKEKEMKAMKHHQKCKGDCANCPLAKQLHSITMPPKR